MFDWILVPDIVIPNTIGLVGVVVTVNILEEANMELLNDVPKAPIIVILPVAALGAWDVE